MALFSRNKNKNWDIIKNRAYDEDGKNRDVHNAQIMERGKLGEAEKPGKYRVFAVMVAAMFSVLGFIFGCVALVFLGFVDFVQSSGGASFMEFELANVPITSDWRLWAFTAFVFLMAWLIANEKFMANLRSRNSMVDNTDINSYENDQHIMLVPEIHRKYDWFPDTGAHSSVQVSSILSHAMIDKKGIKSVDVVERHDKDVVDESGAVVAYKGEPVVDGRGVEVVKKKPLIDEAFGQDLFTESGIPLNQKAKRKPFDVRQIEYNPVDESGRRTNRDKQDYDSVAELINEDWEFPEYEVQRPAGAYLVDTAPVNTMVLAITRVTFPDNGNHKRPAYL